MHIILHPSQILQTLSIVVVIQKTNSTNIEREVYCERIFLSENFQCFPICGIFLLFILMSAIFSVGRKGIPQILRKKKNEFSSLDLLNHWNELAIRAAAAKSTDKNDGTLISAFLLVAKEGKKTAKLLNFI